MTTLSRRSGLALIAALLLATLGAYVAYARPAPSRLPHGATAHAATKPGPVAAAVQMAQQPNTANELLNAIAQALPVRAGGEDGVQLTVRTDRGAVLRGSDGELHVEIALEAKPQSGVPRVESASEILVVLDISGSMEGEKLLSAKQALHKLIARLGPNDRFGLVAYANEAELLVRPARVSAALREHVDSIVDGLGTLGGTNISAGLDLALTQLASSGDGRTTRVLLLSDGHANSGDSSLAGLQDRARQVVRADHVLSTLGIGDDFNEDLMASLADTGTGNFFYLSRVEVLDQFVDAELRASERSAAARALALRFEPGPGVQLLDASGYPLVQEAGAVVVRPGNLYPGQKRSLWLTLKAPTGHAAQLPLGSFSLQYKVGRGDSLHQLDVEPLPLLAVVDDAPRFERAIDKTLWQRFVLEAQRHQVGLQLGAAVGNGTAADVDRAVGSYESNRALAKKLGAKDVLSSLDAFVAEGAASKAEQQASAQSRSYNAKQRKARALYNVRPNASLELNPYHGL